MILVNEKGKISECEIGSRLTGESFVLIVVFEQEFFAYGDRWKNYCRATLKTRLLPDGKIIRAAGVL